MAYSTPKEVAEAKMLMENAVDKLRRAHRQMSGVGPARVNPASTEMIRSIGDALSNLVDELGPYV